MSDAAGRTVVAGDGRRITLGKLIKSGGAGSVYRVPDAPASVAKLYHANQDVRTYERKVAAMLELRPKLPELQDGDTHIVQLAWPQAALFDANRRFLGYLMPTVDIDATSELECVLMERQARSLGLPTGLGAKVTLAANLCTVIGELHRQRHYIVDLKPVNLRFYRRSLYLALLDCDGFSIQGHGERFEAPQFTPDYLAPEFHAAGLNVAGEAQQDRFALAVVVFQLLNFGIHPFTGRPQSSRVPTDIPGRIAGRWYAHGLRGNASLLPAPASGHAAMPHELRTLFDRAFEHPGSRPSADEWSDLLRGYAQRAAGKLRVCARNDAHQHFTGHDCAACVRGERLAEAQAAAASATRTSNAPRTGTRLPPPPRTPPRKPPPPPPSPFARGPRPPPPPPAWPAPKPRPTAHATLAQAKPVGWGTVFASLTGFVVLMFLVIAVLNTVEDPNRPSLNAMPAPYPTSTPRPQVLSAPEAPAVEPADDRPDPNYPGTLVANPAGRSFPLDLELRETKARITSVIVAAGSDNRTGVQFGLRDLRAASTGRRNGTRAIPDAGSLALPAGSNDELAAEAEALRVAPVDSARAFKVGWQLLEHGDRPWAERWFLQAIWADADNADAWYAYGLVQDDGGATIGAMAVAMVLYGDGDKANAALAGAVENLYRLPMTRDQLFDQHLEAREAADRISGRVRPLEPPASGFTGPAGAGPQPGTPYPSDADLQAVEERVLQVAAALAADDATATGNHLARLHEGRRARVQRWSGTPMHEVRVTPGSSGLDVDSALRLAQQPFDAPRAATLGWQQLERRDDTLARRYFLHAIWADPANADAWFGYGLVNERNTGAIAMGLLLGEPNEAAGRRGRAKRALLGTLAVTARGLNAQLAQAQALADGMRPRIQRSVLLGR